MPYPRANTSAINRAPYKYGHKKHENNSKNFQPLPLQPSTCPLLYKEIGLDLAISYCTPGARRYKNGQRFACSVRATEQFAVKKSRRKNICIISISVFFRFASFIVFFSAQHPTQKGDACHVLALCIALDFPFALDFAFAPSSVPLVAYFLQTFLLRSK